MIKSEKIITKSLTSVLSIAIVITSLSITSMTTNAKAKIKSVKVTSPVVNGGKLVLKKGQKKQIKVKVAKSGKISKKVTYKSSNIKVAKIIQSKGKVYVKAVGKSNKTAKITITSDENKNKKAILNIKIGNPIKDFTVTEFKITTSVTNVKETDAEKRTKKLITKTKFVSTDESILSLTEKYDDKIADTTNQQTAKISVKYSPTNVGYKEIKWKAENSNIVYVSSDGVVTPVKPGSTKIYGYTKDGTNKKITVKVTVKGKNSVGSTSNDNNTTNNTNEKDETGSNNNNIIPQGSLNMKSTTLDITQSVELKLTGTRAKSWESLDENIAIVDENGKVTAVQKGNTTIICTDTNGAKYECKVNVIYPDIKFNSTFLASGTKYDMYYLTFNIENNTNYNCRLGGTDFTTGRDVTAVFLYLYGFINGDLTAAYSATTTPEDVFFDMNETIDLPANTTSTLYLVAGKNYGIKSSTNYLWTLTIEDTKYGVLTDITGRIITMVSAGKSDVALP